MEYMDGIFNPYLDQSVMVFIYENLVYTKAEKEHIEHLRMVLQTLKDNKFYANLSKWEFWRKEVTFLGYVISSNGLLVDPSKVYVVLQWEMPKMVIDTRSFLGLTNYYRSLIEGFSKLVIPLTKWIQKGQTLM